MAIGAHKRDPVSREWFFFADPDNMNEWTAQRYFELATTHLISFRGIFQMTVALLQEHYDLVKELDAMGEVAKRDADLLRFKLPIKEALAIWERSREGLLRLAELFPEKREKIEARVAEQQDVMLAMLERYERLGKAS